MGHLPLRRRGVLTLEGGRRILDIPDEARDLPPETHRSFYRWEVYAEECAPWRLFHRPDGPAMVFHPDIPVWGPGTLMGSQPRWAAPTAWFTPPLECPGSHGPCEGARRAGTECVHMWWPLYNSRVTFPHASHGPVALELDARRREETSPSIQHWNPRSIPVAAHALRTLWPRGVQPFEVSLPPPTVLQCQSGA